MSLNALVTSDLHLTSAPDDDYRWAIFDLLLRKAKQYNIKNIFILGDLTDAKDRHPAELVSKITSNLSKLAAIANIYIIAGNHDRIDYNTPFFYFLNKFTNIKFMRHVTEATIDGCKVLFLPNSDNPHEDWKEKAFEDYDYIFAHQCFNKALASNGTRLEGADDAMFKNSAARIISGDIHVPQKLNYVEYVGSPYRIKFGDDFNPRVLLFRNDKKTNIRGKFLTKHVVRISSVNELAESDFGENDLLKIILTLTPEEYSKVDLLKSELTNIAENKGAKVHSIECTNPHIAKAAKQNVSRLSPKQTISRFSKNQELDKYTRDVGLQIMSDAE